MYKFFAEFCHWTGIRCTYCQCDTFSKKKNNYKQVSIDMSESTTNRAFLLKTTTLKTV